MREGLHRANQRFLPSGGSRWLLLIGAIGALDAIGVAAPLELHALLLGMGAVAALGVTACLWHAMNPHAGLRLSVLVAAVELLLAGLVLWRLPSMLALLFPAPEGSQLLQVAGRFDVTVFAVQGVTLAWLFRVVSGRARRPSHRLIPARRHHNGGDTSYAEAAGSTVLLMLLCLYFFRGEWMFPLLADLKRGTSGFSTRPGMLTGVAIALAAAALGSAAMKAGRHSATFAIRTSRRLHLVVSLLMPSIGWLLAAATVASLVGIVLVVIVPQREWLTLLRRGLWEMQVIAAIALLVTHGQRSDHHWHAARTAKIRNERDASRAAAAAAECERERLDLRRRTELAHVDPIHLADELALVETECREDLASARARLASLIAALRTRVPLTPDNGVSHTAHTSS